MKALIMVLLLALAACGGGEPEDWCGERACGPQDRAVS